MDGIIKYGWPGNVQELINAVERAVVLARSDYSDYIDEKDLPAVQGGVPESVRSQQEETWNMPLEEVEKTTILKTLESLKGNKSETARRLGITRRTLHKKLKKYGVMP